MKKNKKMSPEEIERVQFESKIIWGIIFRIVLVTLIVIKEIYYAN